MLLVEPKSGWLATLLTAFLAIVLGAIVEGGIVGYAQWQALHPFLPDVPRVSWIRATMAGAGVAWVLGMVPSTVMSLREASAGGPSSGGNAPPEMEGPIVYLLAALMGLLLGPILGAFQWKVLRRHIDNALLWLPANGLAWALGMAAIFLGTNAI
jgi:hypothetical protein